MAKLFAQVETALPEAHQQIVEALDTAGVGLCGADRSAADFVLRDASAPATKTDTSRPVVAIWRHRNPSRSGNPFGNRKIRHVLGGRPGIDPEELKTTVSQLNANTAPTVEDLIGDLVALESVTVTASAEKSYHLERLARFAVQHNLGSFLLTGLEVALDEMLTNAFYNAPVEAGRHVNAGLSRTVNVVSPRPVTVQFARSSRQVAVVVRDRYGSLPAEEVIDNLWRCYRAGKAEVEKKAGGAGLGFFVLLQNANRLVINIVPGQYCEIIVVRDLGRRRREFVVSAPTLNIFVGQHSGSVPFARRHRREMVSWPTVFSQDGRHFGSSVLDVSQKGAFLKLEQPGVDIGPGVAVELCMVAIPGREPIYLRGVVRWCGLSQQHCCSGFGVEFDSECGALGEILSSEDVEAA